MSGPADRAVSQSGSAGAAACDAELCIQTRALQEAICLTRHGARAGLVSQLTGLEKTVANRLYRQLHGRPSPSGQLPFADTWYLKQDGRMAQAALVWQLAQRFAQSRATRPAPDAIIIATNAATITSETMPTRSDFRRFQASAQSPGETACAIVPAVRKFASRTASFPIGVSLI